MNSLSKNSIITHKLQIISQAEETLDRQGLMSAPPKNSFVPPIIQTATPKDKDSYGNIVELTDGIDDILQIQDKQHLSSTDEDSITEDTSVDYSTELEYSIADDDEGGEEEDDDATFSYASSTSSSSSSSSSPSSSSGDDDEDSTRRLLKQAHQRIEHQSIYEEVKHLRTQLNQQLEIVNKCNELEHQLAKATHTIDLYKQKEKKHEDEMAKSEMEFMSKLNEMCEMMEVQIVSRDERIVELQKKLNEKETIIAQLICKNKGTGLLGNDVGFSDFI